MDELLQRLQALLQTPVITLEAPVTVSQILVLITMVGVSVLVAGFLRWWFRRLFHRLSLSERLAGRLLAVLVFDRRHFGCVRGIASCRNKYGCSG